MAKSTMDWDKIKIQVESIEGDQNITFPFLEITFRVVNEDVTDKITVDRLDVNIDVWVSSTPPWNPHLARGYCLDTIDVEHDKPDTMKFVVPVSTNAINEINKKFTNHTVPSKLNFNILAYFRDQYSNLNKKRFHLSIDLEYSKWERLTQCSWHFFKEK